MDALTIALVSLLISVVGGIPGLAMIFRISTRIRRRAVGNLRRLTVHRYNLTWGSGVKGNARYWAKPVSYNSGDSELRRRFRWRPTVMDAQIVIPGTPFLVGSSTGFDAIRFVEMKIFGSLFPSVSISFICNFQYAFTQEETIFGIAWDVDGSERQATIWNGDPDVAITWKIRDHRTQLNIGGSEAMRVVESLIGKTVISVYAIGFRGFPPFVVGQFDVSDALNTPVFMQILEFGRMADALYDPIPIFEYNAIVTVADQCTQAARSGDPAPEFFLEYAPGGSLQRAGFRNVKPPTCEQ